MSVVPAQEIDTGSYCQVYVPGDGTVMKLTMRTFGSLGAAEELCTDLMTYATALSEDSTATARVFDANPVETGTGYKVAHRMEYIAGPGLYDVSRPVRDEAIKAIIGDLATAATGPLPHSLATPVDAHLQNYRLGDNGPVLIDVCPPYRWNDQGCVKVSAPLAPLPAVEEMEQVRRTWAKGLKPGSIALLLAHNVIGLLPEQLPKDQPDAWMAAYQPFLPPDLDPLLEAVVYEHLAPLVGHAPGLVFQ